ncbi:tail fiber protein [Oceaniserpentilla sp. 4NH20-0058]|uniref:phage tail protein n=1 Tax=Oceaniserpentilla sp. 4NH20-0058 TaxID=3127660 RepID=UPI003102CC25
MKPQFNIKKTSMILGLALSASVLSSKPAFAGPDPFLGEMMLVGYQFCPRNWMEANGQLLAISQFSALFSLYGTTYGGDGRTTFGLPDLRGRAPIHYNNQSNIGLKQYPLGQKSGYESLTVTVANMPSHSHDLNATNETATKNGPGTDIFAIPNDGTDIYHEGPANKVMDPSTIGNTGGGLPIEYRSPYLAMRWCVAIQGVFPSRP